MERGMRMLTIEALNAYGADTQAGLRRCLGDESFYLGLVEMLVCDSVHLIQKHPHGISYFNKKKRAPRKP